MTECVLVARRPLRLHYRRVALHAYLTGVYESARRPFSLSVPGRFVVWDALYNSVFARGL